MATTGFLSRGLASGYSVARYLTLPVHKALMSATGGGSDDSRVSPYGIPCKGHPKLCNNRISHLDDLYLECHEDPCTVSVATDTTVPSTSRHQAVSGYGMYIGGRLRHQARFASGRVTALDAELTAIRFGLEYLITRKFECNHIVLFTDSIAAAK
ncbi:hypothetical protein L218DRAFT_996150 [Marasmius fiardii PR-910]|nr:hypothetical protein L218DRAFT_996150 [Marasmius fiardii PR-910]